MKYTFLQRVLGIHKLANEYERIIDQNKEIKDKFEDLLEDHQIQTQILINENLHRVGDGIVPEDLGFAKISDLSKTNGKPMYYHQEYNDLKVIRIQGKQWAVIYGKDINIHITVKDANWFVLSVSSILSSAIGEEVCIVPKLEDDHE